jgi:hypothetical protein
MNNLKLREAKKRIVRRIMSLVKPHQHNTGYIFRHEPREYVRIWMPRKDRRCVSIPRNLVATSILGITQEGIAESAYGGGLLTVYWSGIPIEDLNRIERFVSQRLDRQKKLFAS